MVEAEGAAMIGMIAVGAMTEGMTVEMTAGTTAGTMIVVMTVATTIAEMTAGMTAEMIAETTGARGKEAKEVIASGGTPEVTTSAMAATST